MKVFFSLIVFSLMLAACQACYVVPFSLQASPGERIPPNTCIDRFNKKTHLIGSTWIADDCFQCSCDENGMFCCHRDFKEIPGCKRVLNEETCENEYYRIDDPTQRCDV